jgi:hypothetical protein
MLSHGSSGTKQSTTLGSMQHSTAEPAELAACCTLPGRQTDGPLPFFIGKLLLVASWMSGTHMLLSSSLLVSWMQIC